MYVPKVNESFLNQLESMGFPLAQSTRALHYSGNNSIEDAVNWIIDHENDPDIDQMPLVSTDIDISIDSTEQFSLTEEMKRKAQELRDQARKKNEEEKRFEREREKKRISYGKELMEAKRVLEENERKRYLALKQSEKEEEKRAKEKIKWKLEQDKLERRGKVQMPLKSPAKQSVVQQKQISHDPIMSVSKVELMSECLRSLKRNHMDNEAKVRRAFQTLLTYVGNVARDPNQEKFRKIRMSNPKFQERIGGMKEGVEFLELCGFERREEFLYLDSEKVNMALLNSAGSLLKSAITNPFFGVFTRPKEEI
ncbi:hypothetical protein G4B88_012951 [Cannabis sativa]|uniref:UBA domain-containing protein n=1 Tax=Cannabis sativa TaxID=3483 RepID=A0A7J6FI07_CANSA|nr:hypothetical protein G4B88_012951 [Cannabis sativa]